MVKERELEQQGRLVEEELELLAQEIAELKLNHRAEIDNLKLELKALQFFLSQVHPEFDEQFKSLREKVRLEINPE
ncbi:MAG: hypothetical protein ACRD6N_04120 [Pyrinomonadaceae bacterium]